MTLLQMQYFQAVCLYDSVSIAAERLHVSQPTISTAIKLLENEFGIQLFQKSGKKLQLTEAGSIFLNLCNSILADTTEALHTMQKLSGQNKQVRLGTEPTLAAVLLPSLYKKYGESFPDNDLYVEESETQLLIQRLNNKEIDIIMIRDVLSDHHKYHQLPLINMECVFCLSQKHPLSVRDSINVGELNNFPLIAFPSEVPPYSLPDDLFVSEGLQANIVYRSNQLATIRRMIINNSMGHFTYRNLAETWQGVHVCSLEPPNLQTISLYWRKDSYLSSGEHGLIRCLKELCNTDGYTTNL